MSDIRKQTIGVGCYSPHPWIDEDKRRLEQCPWCEVERLRRELAEARADAARYRWLCDGHGYFMEEEMLCGHSNEKAAADAAIDAALAAEVKP